MKLLLGAFLILLLAATASADSVWTYTGNSVNYPQGVNPGPIGINPCNCSLDGSVTLNDAGQVTSWDFTVGSVTLTNLNSTGMLGQTLFYVFNPEANYFRWSLSIFGSGVDFHSQFDGSYSDSTDFGSNGLMVNTNPGTWTDPVSTPEPGTLALLAVGLAALAFKRRRKPTDTTVWETLA